MRLNLRQALRTALSARKQDGRLFFIDSIVSPTYKTQELDNILSHWHTKKALIVHGDYEQDANMMVGLRNNQSYNLLPARGANVHDLLRAPIILMSLQGLKDIESRLDPAKDHRRTATFVSPVLGLKSLNQVMKEAKSAAAV
jgi:ribosomal protein L4